MKDKVSFVCTTFRRATCVERIIAQFHAQTYRHAELIIFNTDQEYPISLAVPDEQIIVINNDRNYQTGLPYTNRGDICRDAVTHATGEFFMLADDDDIYLPWHLQQAVEGITEIGKDAWKPANSFFASQQGIILVQNTLEASVIVRMSRIREIGFRSDLTGYEGLSWYTQLRDERQLDEYNPNFVPSYCFNWSDPAELAGHKQSGDIDNPDNFENHKQQSRDPATRALTPFASLDDTYRPYYDFIRNNPDLFNREYVARYAAPFLT
jgi:glycosyltransferase involved in cell wall biosynthesis